MALQKYSERFSGKVSENTDKIQFNEEGIKSISSFQDPHKRIQKPVKVKIKKKISVIYECVGTKEENQEKIDRVFDLIFEEAMRRRRGKLVY